MKTETHALHALQEATRTADEFNQHWGGTLLRVQPDQAPAAPVPAFAPLEDQIPREWWCATAVFARLYPGVKPTHGQLVRLGRQMAARYIFKKCGPQNFYWIAPPGIAPTATDRARLSTRHHA